MAFNQILKILLTDLLMTVLTNFIFLFSILQKLSVNYLPILNVLRVLQQFLRDVFQSI